MLLLDPADRALVELRPPARDDGVGPAPLVPLLLGDRGMGSQHVEGEHVEVGFGLDHPVTVDLDHHARAAPLPEVDALDARRDVEGVAFAGALRTDQDRAVGLGPRREVAVEVAENRPGPAEARLQSSPVARVACRAGSSVPKRS